MLRRANPLLEEETMEAAEFPGRLLAPCCSRGGAQYGGLSSSFQLSGQASSSRGWWPWPSWLSGLLPCPPSQCCRLAGWLQTQATQFGFIPNFSSVVWGPLTARGEVHERFLQVPYAASQVCQRFWLDCAELDFCPPLTPRVPRPPVRCTDWGCSLPRCRGCSHFPEYDEGTVLRDVAMYGFPHPFFSSKAHVSWRWLRWVWPFPLRQPIWQVP